ncbi:SGNH/GDSL hydrolase family protein [Kribbella sp. NPDC050124]|uniref:SGNH/GDSL hydrolase family protein n=1 Tax=Kribbella sp. NPDC050124 TaxID=3364114 RepID=UPI003796413B
MTTQSEATTAPTNPPPQESWIDNAKRWQVWGPLLLGLLVVIGFNLIGGSAPGAFYIALGSALVVLSILQLLGRRDDARPARRSRDVWLAVAVLAIGLVLVAVWFFVAKVDGLGLIGGIVAYVAAGHLLLVARSSTRWAPARGPGVLAACSALFLAAWLLLVPGGVEPPRMPRLALGLLAFSMLLAPVGVSLVSEDVLRKPSDLVRRRKTIILLSGFGIVAVAIAVVAILAAPGQIYTPFVFAAVGAFLFVGLITAKTPADTLLVAAVLVVLTALGADQVSGPPAAANGRVLVALGDSYMSGEGAEAFYTGTDDSGENECRRASTAYPFVYGRSDAGKREFPGGVVSFACSGARTVHLNTRENRGKPQYDGEPIGGPGRTQFEQLESLVQADPSKVGLILLSIGGNDSGFATIGLTCLAPGNCATQSGLWLSNLANVQNSLKATYAGLNAILAKANADIPVVVVPYPDPLGDNKCGDVALSQTEIGFVHTFVSRLNNVVRVEAAAAKFKYLNTMPTALEDAQLRLCDHGPKTGVNFLSAQSMNGSAEAQINPKNWVHNSLHPDEDGHARMSTVLADWIASQALPAQEHTVPATNDETLQTEPQCGLTELDVQQTGLSCASAARKWVVRETSDWLKDVAPFVALGLLGAWAIWLAELGRYRNGNGILHRLRSVKEAIRASLLS